MYKYEFINQGKKLTEEDIAAAEIEIGLKFPESLRAHYLMANGGELEDDRCVYVNKESGVEFNVNTFLPIKYKRFEEDATLEESFKFFVKDKKFMPAQFVPFAIDDGGYPYAVNMADETISICYLADIEETKNPMRFIASSLREFVEGLITEEEAYG